MTLSDAFVLPVGGGMPDGSPSIDAEEARTDTYTRARVPVTVRDGKIWSRVRGFFARIGDDIAAAWWTPPSLPTLDQVWAERLADRDRVPGRNVVLYGGWVGYNHAVALPAVAVGHALISAVNVALWLALHPARLLLALATIGALVALIFSG